MTPIHRALYCPICEHLMLPHRVGYTCTQEGCSTTLDVALSPATMPRLNDAPLFTAYEVEVLLEVLDLTAPREVAATMGRPASNVSRAVNSLRRKVATYGEVLTQDPPAHPDGELDTTDMDERQIILARMSRGDITPEEAQRLLDELEARERAR